MTDTKDMKTEHVDNIIDWINDDTKVSTDPTEREEVSIDWIKTDSDVSEAPKAEEKSTLIDWIDTDTKVSEAPKAEDEEVSIDWINTDSDVAEASQTETAEIVGAEEDTSAKVEEAPAKEEEPLYTKEQENAFGFIKLKDDEDRAAAAEAKAKADAEAEMMDIYNAALARKEETGMYFEDALNSVLDERIADDPKVKREAIANKIMDMVVENEIPDIYDAALVRMADGLSFEEALEAEMDARVATNPRIRRETITAKIMDMVASEKKRVEANRTISEESAKEIAAAVEKGKAIRESYWLKNEAEELKEVLKIVDNLRKSKAYKEDRIIDEAVNLYLLGDHIEGYKQMSDEQKKAIHDSIAARVAKFEEAKAVKDMEKSETKGSSSILSKIVETVKKHKDIIIVACGVTVAALAAVSFLSPTGLLGLPVVALGPTSTKVLLGVAAFTLAAEHTLKAGLRIINKLADDYAKKEIEKEEALKAGREVLSKTKEKTAEKEVGKTATPEKSASATRTVNVREALIADRLAQKVNG